MIYKKVISSIVLVSVLFLLFTVSASAQELTKIYTDSDVGFSISYPEGWVEGELEGALAWIYDEETSSELIVIMEEIPEGFTAKQYAEAVGDWLEENLSDYKEDSLTGIYLSRNTRYAKDIFIHLQRGEFYYSCKDNRGIYSKGQLWSSCPLRYSIR